MLSALAALLLAPQNPLMSYLQKPDSSFSWKVVEAAGRSTRLQMTSQTWQGIPWKHEIVVAKPERDLSPGHTIFLITGDKAERDRPVAQMIADRAGMTAAVLFDIPNQPLYGGLREDALIAYTFGKFMETGDAAWPLLFPMTKAALRGMDAVQQHLGKGSRKFVVTGASKRGWTTWLVGASGDKRVAGIAPMVYDILNFPKQLAHQKEMFGGKLSEQIQDYESTGLTELLSTPQGAKLTQMMDPYSHLARVKMPVLVVLGGNDRYWAVDAHRLYWNEIKAPKLLKIVPNVGHDLGGGAEAIASITFFARAIAGSIPGGLPKFDWRGDGEPQRDSRLKEKAAWVNASKSLDFRDTKWVKSGGMTGGNKASFTEHVYEAGGAKASFTTLATVTKAAAAAPGTRRNPSNLQRMSLGYQDTPIIPGSTYHVHDGERPQPKVVAPGSFSSQEKAGTPPSDAVILFDGSSLSGWEANGGEAKWKIEGDSMTVVPGSGSIRTKAQFGDCHLHVEFASPSVVKGDGQGRGNSGVFLLGRYEIQVLDCYNNLTYPDGTTGALYGQYPPLVNACNPPGAWNVYDIIWEGPRFKGEELVKPARVTVFLNGVLLHHAKELQGPTQHRQLAKYEPHPETGPLELQDHGDLVRFRNIWYRPLKGYDQP